MLVWGPCLSLEHNKYSTEWELRLLRIHFELLMSLIQQAEKEITVLGGPMDQDHHQKFGLSLYYKGKKDYGCWVGNPVGYLGAALSKD